MSIFKKFDLSNPMSEVAWKLRKEFMAIGVISAVANLLLLTPTFYMLHVYDYVMSSQSMVTLLFITILAVTFFTLSFFSEWIRSKILIQLGLKFDEALNSLIFRKSFDLFLTKPSTNPVELLNDLGHIRQFLTTNGAYAFFDLPWIPIYIYIVFLLHPALGWLALFFMALFSCLGYWAYKNTHVIAKELQEESRHESAYLNGKLKNSDVVYSMGMLGNLKRIWDGRQLSFKNLSTKSTRTAHRFNLITKFFQESQQSLIMAAAAFLVINDELRVSSMIAANLLMAKALMPVGVLVSTLKMLSPTYESYNRIRTALGDYQLKENDLVSQDFSRMGGHYVAKNLTLQMMDRNTPTLSAVNINIEPGKIHLIMGSSGSGKTTLMKTLLGIYPASSGNIYLDGQEVHVGYLEMFPGGLGYLPQDIELFEGTVAENIARFSDVKAEEVIKAAQLADIHDLILRLPQGYDTNIGAAGVRLSGGQRQRLALARAIYHGPAVLFLDEPNSSLDDAGDRALSKVLTEFKSSGKTVLVVSHKKGLMQLADHLVFMEHGKIIFDGAPADFLNLKNNSD